MSAHAFPVVIEFHYGVLLAICCTKPFDFIFCFLSINSGKPMNLIFSSEVLLFHVQINRFNVRNEHLIVLQKFKAKQIGFICFFKCCHLFTNAITVPFFFFFFFSVRVANVKHRTHLSYQHCHNSKINCTEKQAWAATN